MVTFLSPEWSLAKLGSAGQPGLLSEAVVAVVLLPPASTLTLEELRDFAAHSLAQYNLPSRLETVDVLPRSPAGKVLKFILRERFGAG